MASGRSATGTVAVDASVAGPGSYTWQVTDGSADLSAPGANLVASMPRHHAATMSLTLKDRTGATVATATGPSPQSISASVATGSYAVVLTPVSGSGVAALTAAHPGRPAKEVIAYDGADHAVSIDDGTNTVAETLSPSGRVLRRTVTDDVTGAVSEDTTFGYDGPGDSPAYARPTGGGTVTTYVNGPGGLLLTDVGGAASWPVQNGHGDVVGTTDAAGAFTAVAAADEFGVGVPPASRLGWLGAKERFTTGGGLGLVRMGVRLYDPALGRFLEADPVEGGSANDYDYVSGDPVNNFDVAGTYCVTGKNKNGSCRSVSRGGGHVARTVGRGAVRGARVSAHSVRDWITDNRALVRTAANTLSIVSTLSAFGCIGGVGCVVSGVAGGAAAGLYFASRDPANGVCNGVATAIGAGAGPSGVGAARRGVSALTSSACSIPSRSGRR